MPAATHLFFDAVSTLFELVEPVGHGYARVARRFGQKLDPDLANRAFRKAWKAMPPPYPSTAAEPERAWWKAMVQQTLHGAGGTWSDELFQALWDHYSLAESWRLFPETVEVLECLRGSYELGVISNFDGRLHGLLEGLGIAGYFSTVTTSEEARASKPDPAIFTLALKKARCEDPGRAVHIGDSPVMDWEAAKACGMRAFQLDRPSMALTDLLAYLM